MTDGNPEPQVYILPGSGTLPDHDHREPPETMGPSMSLPASLEMLKATSRTFFLPIMQLEGRLQSAVAGAYLGFRAIDEIEDHPRLAADEKARLLDGVDDAMQVSPERREERLRVLFEPARAALPPVTRKLADWVRMVPAEVAPRVADAIGSMALRMAAWAQADWQVEDEGGLDRYTYGVAGAVGVLLADLWAWHDGLQTDRRLAVGFGRGLQSVNILRNREEDRERGVDFFPAGWGPEHMTAYCRHQLALADAYVEQLPPGSIRRFCEIPLRLAHATLEALAEGRGKLSRREVLAVVANVCPADGP